MTLTADQIKALSGRLNLGMARAAASFHEMCGARVELSVPEVKVLDSVEFEAFLRHQEGTGRGKIAAVRMPFSGAFTGYADLIFPTDSGSRLVSVLIDHADSTEVGALKACTLLEIGNIVLNGVLGAMTNGPSDHVIYELPTYLEATADELECLTAPWQRAVLLVHTQFSIGERSSRIGEQELTGRVELVFSVASLEVLFDRVNVLLETAPA